MKLKFLLQILSEFDEECDVEFDVKSIESIKDFGTLLDVYDDGELVIIELGWLFMDYGYYPAWKMLIPKPNEIDFICFKLDFYGGYALKIIKDDFFVPVIDGDMAIQIPRGEIRDALDFLKENGYVLHEHSVVQY